MNTIIMTSTTLNTNPGYGHGTTHVGYQPQPQRPSYPLIPPSAYGLKACRAVWNLLPWEELQA